jgi:hypothetical protein
MGEVGMFFGKRRRASRRTREDSADGQVCIALVLAAIAALLSTLHAQADAIAEHPAAMQPP